jgi:predicted enzyme related to lactoylglutathione lyase
LAVRPTHFEFYSADPEATVEFLTTVFGWRAQQWEDQEYWLLDTGEDSPGINGAVARAGDDGPKTLNTCDVEDLDAAIEAVEIGGGRLLTDIMELEGVGRWVQVEGPGGEKFGLMEPTPQ